MQVEGEARFEGRAQATILEKPWADRAALVPQNYFRFITELRVCDQLLYSLENQGIPYSEAIARIQRPAELLGISSLLQRNPVTLSGGEVQRLAIAVGLTKNPQLLVLDAPFAELDRAARLLLETLITEGLPENGIATCVITATTTSRLLEASDVYLFNESRVLQFSADLSPMDLEDLASKQSIFVMKHNFQSVHIGSITRSHQIPLPETQPEQVPNPVFSLRSLTYQYPGTVRAALRGLSLEFTYGQSVGISGPNGAGKSTLVAVLLGFERAPRSSLFIEGKKPKASCLRQIRARTGVLFQTYHHYFFDNTPRDELLTAFKVRAHSSTQRAHCYAVQTITEISQRFGLDPYLDDLIDNLSVQVRRLLGLACALVKMEDVVVLDEPTAGLDGKGRMILLCELNRVQRKNALVLIVSHDRPFLREVCNYELHLRDGSLECFGPI